MKMAQWNTYKEIQSSKIHRTKGLFVGWTKPTGILGVPYAIFQRPHSQLIIPEYLLTKQTKSRIADGTIESV